MKETESFDLLAHVTNITANNHVDLKIKGIAARANPILDIIDSNGLVFGTINTRERCFRKILDSKIVVKVC